MASIFNALGIGYSGLSVAQNGINTTSHNIANAETEGYNRQRIITQSSMPLMSGPGNVGNGAEVQDIKRIFDNFVFDRFTDVSSKKEFSDFEKKTLEELSTYFPEIDAVGIKSDLSEYYNMWQTLADNPDNDAIKLALSSQTTTLTQHIAYTQNQVVNLHSQLNEQIKVNVNEVNSLAEQLANLNISIDIAEAGDQFQANDLRDKRNVLERTLARLVGAKTSKGTIQSNMQMGSSSNTKTGSYSINIEGFNIIDGSTFHPIHLDSKNNATGFYELSFERQDGVLVPMGDSIRGGVIGSILNLRGSSIDSSSGMPTDGIVQNVIAQLDAFSKGLIESTNNIYAKNSTTRMDSNILKINPAGALVSSGVNINSGSFDLVIYDIDGNVSAKRNIEINSATTMTGAKASNSIEGQIKQQLDDNNDNNANNDLDDYIQFNWATYASGDNALELAINPLYESKGYTFAIEDSLDENVRYSSGTNFAGALGLGRYFDGNDAQSIQLNSTLNDNPTLISAGSTPLRGDSSLALNIVQHQYEKFNFHVGSQDFHVSAYAMFDIIATEVGTQTNAAIVKNETLTTQFNATELEYFSASKVGIDEEMANLIKYQTSYGAAAKVITTIDQMMQTLLGIKQ